MAMKQQNQIRITLEVHAVTCPGVYLCQNGDVEMTINCLGYNFRSQPLPPRFPLCFHETFTMEGYYNCIDNSVDLDKVIANENIDFALWQKERRLAFYTGTLGVLLHPHHRPTDFHTDTDLIMTKSRCFPGSLAPKIEIFSRIEVKQTCRSCQSNEYKSLKQTQIRSQPITDTQHCSKPVKVIERPRPVCHSRQSSRCRQNFKIQSSNYHDIENEYENSFCNNCIDKMYSGCSQDGEERSASVDSFGSNHRASPDVPRANYCGHKMYSTSSTSEAMHPKSCSICQNYRKYFKLIPQESLD